MMSRMVAFAVITPTVEIIIVLMMLIVKVASEMLPNSTERAVTVSLVLFTISSNNTKILLVVLHSDHMHLYAPVHWTMDIWWVSVSRQ